MRTFFFAALFATTALAQGSIFPDEATKDAAKQFEPENVSAGSRAFLKSKMKNHMKEMKDLSLAVATVKLSEVQRLAQLVANQPRLDPATGAANQLPPRFFELQELLKKTAQDLADAGKASDLKTSLEKYQALVGQCVMCHAAFKAQVVAAGKK